MQIPWYTFRTGFHAKRWKILTHSILLAQIIPTLFESKIFWTVSTLISCWSTKTCQDYHLLRIICCCNIYCKSFPLTCIVCILLSVGQQENVRERIHVRLCSNIQILITPFQNKISFGFCQAQSSPSFAGLR